MYHCCASIPSVLGSEAQTTLTSFSYPAHTSSGQYVQWEVFSITPPASPPIRSKVAGKNPVLCIKYLLLS